MKNCRFVLLLLCCCAALVMRGQMVEPVRFTSQLRILGADKGEVVFTGSSVHCFIENGRPIAFGNRFPGFIEALRPYMRQ